MRTSAQHIVLVYADWQWLGGSRLMGRLFVTPARGKEVFSFEYDTQWLKDGLAQTLDPALQFYRGQQYLTPEIPNFGLFLDSSPDRWGRTLMKRREAIEARAAGRPEKVLRESDFLLGVYDLHRMGGLRFRTEADGPFRDDNAAYATPPYASLRELENASRSLEKEGAERQKDYREWLRLLIAPGGSLGGARPKAGVVDPEGSLWIAKFPALRDDYDVGAWEYVVHRLARESGIDSSEAHLEKFGSPYHTFLTKRFDRTPTGERIHFASAMTLLGKTDGEGAEGASYLDLAEILQRQGARARDDQEQLWRRIVFSVCVSNTDDHLRNHGFILDPEGWLLSPAYDMNPVPYAEGLVLNIS